MGRLREVDRRVATRAWTPVRRPSLPAWAWFLIDIAAGSLAAAGLGELVTLASETIGQIIQAVGFFAVVAVAVAGFVRSTRDALDDGPAPD